MKFRFALLALALACNGDEGDKTGVTGDTADSDTDDTDTECPNGQFTGDITIASASLTCTGTTATVSAVTTGVPAGGAVFFQETGNAGTDQWTENHPLTTGNAHPCGDSAELTHTITTGVAIDDVGPDASLFSCAQLDDNDYMGVAVFAVDANDAVIDCFAFGNDTAGLIAGTHTIITEPDYELAGCEEGTEGM